MGAGDNKMTLRLYHKHRRVKAKYAFDARGFYPADKAMGVVGLGVGAGGGKAGAGGAVAAWWLAKRALKKACIPAMLPKMPAKRVFMPHWGCLKKT